MIHRILLSLLGISLGLSSIEPLAAQLPLTRGEIEIDGQSVGTINLINWEKMSLSAFGNMPSSGQIQLPDGQVITWKQEDNITSVLPILSFSEWLGLEQLTGEEIEAFSGINWEKVSLDNFPLLTHQTLSTLAQIVPELGATKIEEILPIVLLFKGLGVSYSPKATLIENLAVNPALGQLRLNQYLHAAVKEKDSLKRGFQNVPVTAIPNIKQVAISSFEGWETATLLSVPGLSQVSLALMPKSVTWPITGFARIDFIYGESEGQQINPISGSDVEGFQVPCLGQPCPSIELDDLENSGVSFRGEFEGKQWINGLYQDVEGGRGCLKGVNGGREPTGRNPYGIGFKLVVTKTQETTDTVEMSAYFRFCNFCGCTPYYLGPFPFQKFQVNDWIYLGF